MARNLRMVDLMVNYTLNRIKSLITSGRFRFTEKADAELVVSSLTRDDALEAILYANKIDKILNTTSYGKTHGREKIYIIQGFTYDRILVYTKGTIKITDEQELLYRLISAKRAGML